MNKKHLTGTVPANKEHFTGTVPVNKEHLNLFLIGMTMRKISFHSTRREGQISLRKRLFTGTVPVNKEHFTGTVPVNKEKLVFSKKYPNQHLQITPLCGPKSARVLSRGEPLVRNIATLATELSLLGWESR